SPTGEIADGCRAHIRRPQSKKIGLRAKQSLIFEPQEPLSSGLVQTVSRSPGASSHIKKHLAVSKAKQTSRDLALLLLEHIESMLVQCVCARAHTSTTSR